MKYFITLILTIHLLPSYSQSDIQWSAPVTVAAMEYDNLRPRLSVDAAGNAIVIWGDGAGDNVFFAKWNGTAFTAPLKINPENEDVFVSDWAGPELASSGDTVYIVFKQQPEDYTPAYIVRSFDAGSTFSVPYAIENIADSISRFPVVAINSSGNPVVGFMKFNADFLDSRWSVAVSNDYGTTFFNDVQASGFVNDEVCDCCPGSVVVSSNAVIMLYRNNKNNYRNMWAGISTNHGITFSEGIPVDDTNWSLNYCPSSGPDGVLISDTLYTVFMSGASGANRVYLSTTALSDPEGSTTKFLDDAIPALNSQNFPRIAHHDDAMALVWKQVVNNDAQIAFLFRSSSQAGFPAESDVIAASSSNNLTNPDVHVSNGKVHVVWQNNADNSIQYLSGNYNLTGTSAPALQQPAIQIYPNPASAQVTLNVAANSVTVFDLHGRQIHSQYDSEGKLLDVSSLSNGLYTIRIQQQQQVSIQKLIIQH